MQAPAAVSATPDASQTNADRRLASLDGLRGIAALSIFAFHGWLYTMPAPDATNRSSIGDYAVHELRLAVVLFFVLSGFLLSRPWFAAALGERPAPSLGRYVRSRAVRILPAYNAALVGSIALLWGLDGTPGLRLPPAEQLPLFFVFAQDYTPASVMKLDPPMWTLATEVSFYAVLPLIGWLALRVAPRRRSLAAVPLSLLALGTFYNWSIAGQGLSMTFSKTLAAMLPYFALGMLAALAAHGRSIDMRAKRLLVAAGIAIVACDAFFKAAAPAEGIDATMLFSIIRDLPSACGFALIVGALALAPRSRIVGGRVLAAFGTVSYGFYLWHVPVYLVLRGHGLLPLDPLRGMAVAFLPALALSATSWFALERPALRWLARRERRRAARPLRSGGVERSPGGRELGGAEVSTVRA
ncbi:MAG TPA: acyltransferase [Solirubrobacteraceae bacterium]|nr:acyltransferase [Solirubrobacteraceae bacterium]